MSERPLDFVQLTYNVADRAAERRLLPLAAERGIAVIANRPFRGGALFRRVAGLPLPGHLSIVHRLSWPMNRRQRWIIRPPLTFAMN